MSALGNIQAELKAPKNQHNKFGGYNYRSCEDILEAVKPLLKKHDAVLTISDSIEEVGGRVYVKATARLAGKEGIVEVSAYAREAETKKGMDESQITGAASSYARKYALNGLFCIDDTKDADHGHQEERKPVKPVQEAPPKPEKIALEEVIKELEGAFSQSELAQIFKSRWPMAQAHYNKGEIDKLITKKDEMKQKFAA